MKKEIKNAEEAFDLSMDLSCGNIEQLGIFLSAAMNELREAYEIGGPAWKKINASLVLLGYCKQEYDSLERKYGVLHNFLDEQSLSHGKEDKAARKAISKFKLSPEVAKKAQKKMREVFRIIEGAEKEKAA